MERSPTVLQHAATGTEEHEGLEALDEVVFRNQAVRTHVSQTEERDDGDRGVR